jgi:hypothetical protein
LGNAHRASFIVWFGVMAIHVLGHLTETGRLAVADYTPSKRPRVAGAKLRTAVVALSMLAGLGLAVGTIGWVHNWRSSDVRRVGVAQPFGH